MHKYWKMVALVSLATLGLASSVTLAQAPAMPAVEFPVDTSTIGPVVVAAGAAILILIYPIKLGFSFLKRLVRRMASAV